MLYCWPIRKKVVVRKSKTIKIDDREITVKELYVKDFKKILKIANTLTVTNIFSEIVPIASDLPVEDFDNLAPSEIEYIWNAIKEVNSVFFNVAVKSGMFTMLKKIFLKDLTAALLGLSEEATEEKI